MDELEKKERKMFVLVILVVNQTVRATEQYTLVIEWYLVVTTNRFVYTLDVIELSTT